MEKVELRTADIAAENAAKLAELFPDIVTEVLDEDGNVRHSIDVEALKAHVGDIAEDKRERYQFTWPGKQKARAEAIRPIDKTMRPCPEESVNWDTTENLYIEGDNLDALKILRENYPGKIKMIYIDPPYNTGHDFVYNDSFARSAEEERAESGAFDEEGNVLDASFKENRETNGRFHSDWCSMMYPRLVLARDLLSDDGVIFASIDDSEQDKFKLLLSEVFGSHNFLAEVVWERAYSPINLMKHFSPSHDYVLCFAKNIDVAECYGISRSAEADGRYQNPDNDPRGPWKPSDLSVGPRIEEKCYPITTPSGRVVEPPAGRCWRLSKKAFFERLQDGRIWFGERGDNVPSMKRFRSELRKAGVTPMTIWKYTEVDHSQGATQKLAQLFDGNKLFDYPKPVDLVKRCVQLYSEFDSIALDFFSGSATTAHAVMQLNAEDGGNRKFIMVQLPEVCDEKSEAAKAGYKNICEIGKERIRRAGAKITAEVEESNAQLKLGEEPKRVPDIGFRVLKIDSSNFEDVSRTPDTLFQDALFSLADNVKPGRTPEDILFQLFPKLEIPYTARSDTFDICGKTVYSVDDDTLVACFDREVPEDVVRAMAEREPAWAVLRDASFTGDDALANFEEIFKTVSPETKTRVV